MKSILYRFTCSSTEKAMAPHFSTLAWKIPWMEEPGRLQSMGSLRVRHDWATWLSLITFHFSLSCIGEGNGNFLQCSCLENPRDGEAWWAAVYRVAQSWTRLKWLSSTCSTDYQKLNFVTCVGQKRKSFGFRDTTKDKSYSDKLSSAFPTRSLLDFLKDILWKFQNAEDFQSCCWWK